MQNPLLSIVIATKNRQRYAFNAVESILSLADTNFEVIVQDNSDINSLQNSLESYLSDERLVYNYTNEVYSFIDNFNAAVTLANGKYVCIIGDDDGINPKIIDAVIWADINNVEVLVGSLSANYRWDGIVAPDTLFTKMTPSTLTITSFTGKAYKVDLTKSLIKLMRNGCTNYLDFDMPKLYHGLVRKDSLDKIKDKLGSYMGGLSPDIYSSVTLACSVNTLVVIDYPLTIPGICAESASVKEGQLKQHSKRLEDAPHLVGQPNYKWTEDVPRIYCVQAIWADSAFAAFRDIGRTEFFKDFNRFKLYVNIITADSSVKKQVFTHMKAIRGNNLIMLSKDYIFYGFAMISGPLKKFFFKRAFGRFKFIVGIESITTLENVDNIFKAMHALTKYIQSKKMDLSSQLSRISLR